jgi:cell wall-associated NlpC family hydrolase
MAERFIGVPYLWGGKTAAGLDCSGLVQIAMLAAGQNCPRDSDMQMAALGTPIETNTANGLLRRGDLVFWSGHVGIMTDPESLLHANVFHMEVAREPIRGAVARIEAEGNPVIDIRRISVDAPLIDAISSG